MKIQHLAAVISLAVCAGCQSPNLFSDRSDRDFDERHTQVAQSSNDVRAGTPGLPLPTNSNPRKAIDSIVSVDQHLKQGEAQLSAGDQRQALWHFEQALATEPQNARANHRMAVVCDQLGEFQKAEQHYQIALQKDPRNVSLLSDIGYSYWMQGRHSESERYLLQARKIDPSYETAVANLGMLYGTTGRTPEALAMFRQIGDEAQVQQAMQQVVALAPPTNTPAVPAAPWAAAAVASNSASFASANSAPREPELDLSQVNQPTRELLELMEQGRRQQEQANQPRQLTSVPPQSLSPVQHQQPERTVPPFAQHRANVPQPRPSPIAGLNPFDAAARTAQPRPATQTHVPDHLLNQALAEIDRSGQGPQSGQRSIGLEQRPQPAVASTAWPSSGTVPAERSPSANTMQSFDQAPSQVARNSYDWATGATQQSALAQHNAAISGQPQEWSQPGPGQAHQPPPGTSMRPEKNGTVEFAGGEMQEAGRHSGVQQASALVSVPDNGWSGSSSNNAPQVIEHAHHQQQNGAAAPITLMQGTTADRREISSFAANPAAETPGSLRPVAPSTGDNSANPYEQARRQAALMGMEAGPGQMFPYVQQAQRTVPGADSQSFGGHYQQAPQSLPSTVTQTNHTPSFHDAQAASLAPQPNGYGQPAPLAAAPPYTPAPYGAATSGGRQDQSQPQTTYAGRVDGSILQGYGDARGPQSSSVVVPEPYRPAGARSPQSDRQLAPISQPGSISYGGPVIVPGAH